MPRMNETHTELHTAFVWDCNECGVENFQRAIVRSLDPRLSGDLQTIMNIVGCTKEDALETEAILHFKPNKVICKSCKTIFNVVFDDEDASIETN